MEIKKCKISLLKESDYIYKPLYKNLFGKNIESVIYTSYYDGLPYDEVININEFKSKNNEKMIIDYKSCKIYYKPCIKIKYSCGLKKKIYFDNDEAVIKYYENLYIKKPS